MQRRFISRREVAKERVDFEGLGRKVYRVPGRRLRALVYAASGSPRERREHIARILEVLTAAPLEAVSLVIDSPGSGERSSKSRGIDYLVLPEIAPGLRVAEDTHSTDGFQVDMPRVRTGAIRAAALSFEPDLLIVDGPPLGVAGELEPTLLALRSRHRTACVLGVIDSQKFDRTAVGPGSTPSEVIRNLYDEVWVFSESGRRGLDFPFRDDVDLGENVRFVESQPAKCSSARGISMDGDTGESHLSALMFDICLRGASLAAAANARGTACA